LYTDDLIPIPDFKAASSLLQENFDLVQNYDYPDVLSDESLPIVKRLHIFQAFYIGFYEHFKRKCIYIENHLYKSEGRSHALHTLRDIFQLYNDNYRTPPKLPREALKVLIHVRNSCAHRNMVVSENHIIRIRDFNQKNELTYENHRSIVQLNEFYHALIILDKIIDAIALAIMLKREVENLYKYYGRLIKCPDCGTVNYYCILPTIKLIICKKCNFPFILY
jgi:hypothetical protein